MKEETKKLPIVTIVFVAMNIGIWLLLELRGSTTDVAYMVEHGASYVPYILGQGEYFRFISCTFLHFGSAHLVNNMLILLVTGMRLEEALGRVRFAILYLFSGVGGSLLSMIMEFVSGECNVSAGASGAVFGVMGGLMAVALFHHGKVQDLGLKGLLVMLALNLYNGFVSVGVDNWGHIGGVLTGFLIGVIFEIFRRIRRNSV